MNSEVGEMPASPAGRSRKLPQLSSKRVSKVLSDLGTRAAIAARLTAAVARAVADPDRLQELWHRLQDYEQYDRFRSATVARSATFAAGAAGNISFPLLVTSNSGVYLLEQDGWHCLLPVACFGIARHDDTLFVGASAGLHSFVLSARIVGDRSIDGLGNINILARYETRYNNERIHQIAYDARANLIHCANCRRNSLISVDPDGRGIVDEKFLFVDPGGSPFFTDQNHVNSVTVSGDALLFATRYAGRGGGLGFVADDIVRVYQYSTVGVHDVVIHDGGIMFTDSFRGESPSHAPSVSGAIRYRGQEYLSQAIDGGHRKLVLRGLAMRGTVLAVGFSAWARREERMAAAGGGIIVFRDGKLAGLIDGPFGQVFDILPLDGVRTDAAGPVRSAAELDVMFKRDVGPLLFEAPLPRGVNVARLR
jgi:hypothetical protein